MSETLSALSAILNRPFYRRDLLKAGVSSALLSSLPGAQSSAQGRDSKSRGRGRNSGHIVRAAIHPAIGIARVGNSQEEYYLGPEIRADFRLRPMGTRIVRVR